jgi:hypothetical protein
MGVRKVCIVCLKDLDPKNKRTILTCGTRCSRVYSRIYNGIKGREKKC